MFHRLDLAGMRVIVTGASSGIGWALANELAAAKARIVVAARSRERLDELAAKLRQHGADILVVSADVTSPDDRRRLIDETLNALGGIDILVNNAGIGASGHFLEASEERLRKVFEVNFFGTTELTRLALPHLALGRQPMIVNISSAIGRRGIPGYTEYCASKFAMCGWSEALRAELVRQGIHVLPVCPGLVETPFRDHLLEDKFRQTWQQKRVMSAERCARIIVRAMRRRRNEVVITAGAKFLLLMNRWFPRVLDSALARMASDERRNDEMIE